MHRVAVGVRAHAGWVALAAVDGTLDEPRVLERRRVTLVESTDEEFTQPFHVAATLGVERGRVLIERVAREAQRRAEEGLREVGASIAPRGLIACAILASKAHVPEQLEATLQSHALIHAAEGNLFRDAFARAADKLGLRVFRFVEKEIDALLRNLRISPGPPWSKDEKLAALAGLLALGQYQRDPSASVAS